MNTFCTNDAKSVHTPRTESAAQLTNINGLTPAQIKRRAAYARLMGSLAVPQNTKLLHDMPTKQKPVFGVFASV